MAPAGAEQKGHTTTTHRDETLAAAKCILDAFDEKSTNDSRLFGQGAEITVERAHVIVG